MLFASDPHPAARIPPQKKTSIASWNTGRKVS